MKGTPVGSESRRRAARAAVGSAVAAVTMAASAQAEAKDLEVTTTRAQGDGSFIGAVRKAERDGDRDTITFAKNLRGTIKLKGNLTFDEPVAIAGRGYGNRRGDSFRRVTLQGPKRGTDLDLDGYERKAVPNVLRELHLRRVSVGSSGPPLTIKDSYMDGESTVTGSAGVVGQFVYGSRDEAIRVLDTTITGFAQGIDLYKSGARVDRSRISGNLGSGIIGGSYTGVDVVSSTISGNGGVGASVVYESGGDVINSTVTGNEAGGTYGLDVRNSTVAANEGPGVVGYHYDDDSELSNSIVWGNAGVDCGPDVESLGGNLIGTPGDCATLPADLVGENPRLGKLAANGGPTRTMAIGKGSPAIGLAVKAEATKFDQRGVKRGKHPDSGAFER